MSTKISAIESFNIDTIKSDLKARDDEFICDVYESSRKIKKAVSAIEDEIKERIETKGSCGNLEFQEMSGGYEIKDIKTAYSKVSHVVTFDEFLSCCKVSESSLRKLIVKNIIERDNLDNRSANYYYENMVNEILVKKEPRRSIAEKKEQPIFEDINLW